jgi:shikimate kinase
MKVVLIGMKHCGKSTLGTSLAARWGCPFHDIDRLIEEHQARDSGKWLSVRDIFNTLGEARFTELEAQAVSELYLSLHESPAAAVVAVGGRTALNERVSNLLGGIGTVVYLEVSPEEMFQRVLRGGLPSFINQEDPLMSFLELYQERIPHYQRRADITVNLNGLSVEAGLEKLCRELERADQTRRA